MSFISDQQKQFCEQNTDQAKPSSYHHQSNGQVEPCIVCEVYHQKCLDNKSNVNLALLQIGSMPIGAGLPSPATLLFNRPISALLPQINRVHQLANLKVKKISVRPQWKAEVDESLITKAMLILLCCR